MAVAKPSPSSPVAAATRDAGRRKTGKTRARLTCFVEVVRPSHESEVNPHIRLMEANVHKRGFRVEFSTLANLCVSNPFAMFINEKLVIVLKIGRKSLLVQCTVYTYH